MSIHHIEIEDYNYELPSEKIAQQALNQRDSSKLLYYNGFISDHYFNELPHLLPQHSTLFLNDAKVIPARLKVQKETGAWIEVFLLQPYKTDYFTSLNAAKSTQWACLVGNKKKWKADEVLSHTVLNTAIQLKWLNYEQNIIEFEWQNGIKFIDLIENIGAMPLPPYIKREAEKNDIERYQTVYSKTSGAVAAPTAGLHFTENVFKNLAEKGIRINYMTLHVSAGTFLPVTVSKAAEHPMHQEFFSVSLDTLNALQNAEVPIAVGTTSVRVIESLYWCAINILEGKQNPFEVEQLQPYKDYNNLPTSNEAIEILKNYLEKHNLKTITGNTAIMIMPGYDFKFIKGLVTNFHQPKSTLMLLIAALVGDNWRTIYKHALENNYRFLSYGDSSLLLK
jgi:S-adenosylmethionine:tRNA ribosyltransferase-isomerase